MGKTTETAGGWLGWNKDFGAPPPGKKIEVVSAAEEHTRELMRLGMRKNAEITQLIAEACQKNKLDVKETVKSDDVSFELSEQPEGRVRLEAVINDGDRESSYQTYFFAEPTKSGAEKNQAKAATGYFRPALYINSGDPARMTQEEFIAYNQGLHEGEVQITLVLGSAVRKVGPEGVYVENRSHNAWGSRLGQLRQFIVGDASVSRYLENIDIAASEHDIEEGDIKISAESQDQFSATEQDLRELWQKAHATVSLGERFKKGARAWGDSTYLKTMLSPAQFPEHLAPGPEPELTLITHDQLQTILAGGNQALERVLNLIKGALSVPTGRN